MFARRLAAVAVIACVAPLAANAQVSIDMTKITCQQYLAFPDENARVFNAWMSGWFNQKTGSVSVDLNAYARNVENVRKWCASNLQDSVFSGLTRATQAR